jgi:hypothetical protein
VRQPAFDSVHASLKERGYDLVRGGVVDTRPSWMSDRSTVLYYDAQSREQAGRLAGELRALTGQPFAVQLGRGLGVTPGHERSTFFIHWIASRPPVRPVPKPTAPPTVRMRS